MNTNLGKVFNEGQVILMSSEKKLFSQKIFMTALFQPLKILLFHLVKMKRNLITL